MCLCTHVYIKENKQFQQRQQIIKQEGAFPVVKQCGVKTQDLDEKSFLHRGGMDHIFVLELRRQTIFVALPRTSAKVERNWLVQETT